MIELVFDPKKGAYAEGDSAARLIENHFGVKKGKKLWLYPEEVLYVMNFQNGRVMHQGDCLTMNDLLMHYSTEPRVLIKYNAYRDWRDRGLVIRRFEDGMTGEKKSVKRYPAKGMKLKLDAEACWCPDSGMAVVEGLNAGTMLFEEHWFGQLGVYKQDRVDALKLNGFETVLLAEHFGLKVVDTTTGKPTTAERLMKGIAKRREFAKSMYRAYEDWRLKGYIVKTGFKFGTHFRIYFPGASPVKQMKKGGWVHSKHVLHIFPKEVRMLVSEWARAVRVAHGVRKTFILGIPPLAKKDYVEYPTDFVAYRRKKKGKNWVRENPARDKPRYLLAALSEEESIGGVELASMLKRASDHNLSLLLSITDRETAITYYALNKIELPGSKQEYYEIEWVRP